MLTQAQQARLDSLRLAWREAADAARELDYLADLAERSRQFSAEANAHAVALLRAESKEAFARSAKIKADLEEADGWQSIR